MKSHPGTPSGITLVQLGLVEPEPKRLGFMGILLAAFLSLPAAFCLVLAWFILQALISNPHPIILLP